MTAWVAAILVMLGSDGEAAHVGVDIDRLLQAGRRLLGIILLVTVGSVYEVCCRVVLVALPQVRVGDLGPDCVIQPTKLRQHRRPTHLSLTNLHLEHSATLESNQD